MRNLMVRALGMGAVAGLRSTAGPAALSRAAADGRVESLEGTPFEALGSARTAKLLTVLEVGELIGDKLPIAPSRTSPPPLLGRAAIGAFVGAALFASEKRPVVAGGSLGAVSALAAAYVSERLRLQIAGRLGVPDPVVALLEDGLVLLAGARLLR